MIRHIIVKPLHREPGDDAAVLFAHAPSGRLKPHVLPYMRLLAGNGFAVFLIVGVDRPLELLDEEVEAAAGLVVRANAGWDFGAWSHAFDIDPLLYGAGTLVLANDSMVPTSDGDVFAAMIAQVRQSKADIVGLTASHEHAWHVQSGFLACKARALSSGHFQDWMGGIAMLADEDAVTSTYEIPFAAAMKAGGLTVDVVYTAPVPGDPTMVAWRELVRAGFPFVKLAMLRRHLAARSTGHPGLVDDRQQNWPAVLGPAGFDVGLVRMAIRSVESLPSAAEDQRLLLDPDRFAAIVPQGPLRIAFLGPLASEDGEGARTRALVAALRRTGARLNLHPVTPSGQGDHPAADHAIIADFGGHADLAIVAIDPNAWHSLSPGQVAVIEAATRRIGVWSLAASAMPAGWLTRLPGFDRIWACRADAVSLLADRTGRPVDFVPCAGTATTDRRAATLDRFGIGGRMMLAIVSGEAGQGAMTCTLLAASFAATGLAGRGWTLLIVTAGPSAKAVRATRISGVILSSATLTRDQCADVIAAADIYVSVHGGTDAAVGEAIAAGKRVVAVAHDLPDGDNVYPVGSTSAALRIASGAPQAIVDETSLQGALSRAAADVDLAAAGASASADAYLDTSYAAVARTMQRSFADLLDCRPAPPALSRPQQPPPLPECVVAIGQGQPFSALGAEAGYVPVPLAPDLAWTGGEAHPGDAADWLIFAPEDVWLAPDFIAHLRNATAQRPAAAAFYADDAATGGHPHDRIRLKPEFDLTLLTAQDYIGGLLVVRRAWLDRIGGVDPSRGTAILVDLALRIVQHDGCVARIPHVLVGHAGDRPSASPDDRMATLRAHRAQEGGEIEHGLAPGLLARRWRFSPTNAPTVAICIPTCRAMRPAGDGTYIAALLSRLAEVDWPMQRLSVVIGDDVDQPAPWATVPRPYGFRRIPTPRADGEPFNYARKMNDLWRQIDADIVVFMNDDILPCNRAWMHALVGFAAQQRIGGVGARLLYEDGSLQHAGMFPAFGGAVHAWLAMPADAHTYQDWALAQREWSMVTGAIFATRRAVLEEVNGFDERFSLEYNDTDLCLRIRSLGYRIVCNPDAEFVHAEKASRGSAIPPGGDRALFLKRWTPWLQQDPASHPGYAPDRVDLWPRFAEKLWCER